MRFLVALLPGATAYVQDYIIGNHLHSSAWTFKTNERVLDLRQHCESDKHDVHVDQCVAEGNRNQTDCHAHTLHPCPPVIIFDGNQDGTMEVENCFVGRMYTFINRATSDNGIIVQQKGGRFGAKTISQFGHGVCFCSPDDSQIHEILKAQDERTGQKSDRQLKEKVAPIQMGKNPDGSQIMPDKHQIWDHKSDGIMICG